MIEDKKFGFFTLNVYLRQHKSGPMTVTAFAGDDDTQTTPKTRKAELFNSSPDRVEIMVEILTKLTAALEAEKSTIQVKTLDDVIVSDQTFVPDRERFLGLIEATESLKVTLAEFSTTVNKHLPSPRPRRGKPKGRGRR